MTDKSKRCGTCTEWGWRGDVNNKRSCKVDFGEHMRLWAPGGRPVKEYGPRHVCHRPDDYVEVSTNDLAGR